MKNPKLHSHRVNILLTRMYRRINVRTAIPSTDFDLKRTNFFVLGGYEEFKLEISFQNVKILPYLWGINNEHSNS